MIAQGDIFKHLICFGGKEKKNQNTTAFSLLADDIFVNSATCGEFLGEGRTRGPV